jgi:Tfp pilus assembly protein PilP
MARTPFVLIALSVGALACALSAHAQSPASKPAAPPATPPAAPAPAASGAAAPPATQTAASTPPAQEAYTYRADGRRDPFLNLLGQGSDVKLASRRGEGPTGMSLGEISVRGVMQSRGALVAMIQGPDNKTYIVHQGDKLLDGTIKTVMPQGLVVVQEVNDPLSLIKTREVRKLLRSLEDAK